MDSAQVQKQEQSYHYSTYGYEHIDDTH
jgi:hypothetical protein